MSIKVLVTGSNGQLGKAIKKASESIDTMRFVFVDSEVLDVTDFKKCNWVFNDIKPDFCINTSAYKQVDKAEMEQKKVYDVNVIGVRNLAKVCKKNNTTLIQISTDFVFDGKKNLPYHENDFAQPKNIYGISKLDGEREIENILSDYFIIRTSWLYSEFGTNFYKTMLHLASEKKSLDIVNDQIGTPTNANDLAETLLKIIERQTSNNEDFYGIYHFSNEGSCSWYDFAKKIFEIKNIEIKLNPVPTSSFPTTAERPKYSVLDKSKIKKTFGITIKNWEEALRLQHLA